MKVWKAHGLGNDYLVWQGPSDFLTPERVRFICNRHFGVGSDGILEPTQPTDADYDVRIWNPDGSQAEKSGNGLRIFAFWLHHFRGAPLHFTVSTGLDVVNCRIGPDSISIDMGTARFAPESIPCSEPIWQAPHVFKTGHSGLLWAVGMGNPHCVVFVPKDADLDELPWREWGAELEVDRRFPNRTNVQIAQVVDKNTLRIRIWERGAGETSASGSSSCAVAAAAVRMNWCDSPMTLVMTGGELEVAVDPEFSVVLTGPVAVVGTLSLDIDFVKQLMNLEATKKADTL